MPIDSRCFVARVFAGLMLFVLGVAAGRAQMQEKMTPVLLAVEDAPVPFMGSDGRMHLVYELWVANFSSADVTLEKVEVMGDGDVLESLDATAIAGRLQA